MKYPRLFVGPMSRQIVDASIEYSQKKHLLGLIPSRRQIEYSGGYVNNWTTEEFSRYVRQRSDLIYLVRDHGGPNQGNEKDDGCESLKCDVENGFNILHIDPWKCSADLDEGIKKTAEIIKQICSINETATFEVGTEQVIFSYTADELEYLLKSLQSHLGDGFSRISYAVVQSGVKIVGTRNVGIFNPKKLKKMNDIVHDFGILSKEHNGDYLNKKQIQDRVDLGLDAINIAPEFGVMQTRLFLNSAFTRDDFESAYSICEKSKKYIKWLPKDLKRDSSLKKTIIEVSGHYVFTEEPFSSSMDKIKAKFKTEIFKRFDEIHEAWNETN